MRTLLIIALAAALVGCSRQPPLQAATKPAHLQVRHRAAHFITKAKPARTKTEATATRIPPPPPSSRTQIEPKSGVAESRAIKEQVVAATGVAERMTVAALAPARDDVKRDLLVAVVMARPEIKSVSDLGSTSRD